MDKKFSEENNNNLTNYFELLVETKNKEEFDELEEKIMTILVNLERTWEKYTKPATMKEYSKIMYGTIIITKQILLKIN